MSVPLLGAAVAVADMTTVVTTGFVIGAAAAAVGNLIKIYQPRIRAYARILSLFFFVFDQLYKTTNPNNFKIVF